MYFCDYRQTIKGKMDILRAVGAKCYCMSNVEPTDPRSYYSVSKKD
jgi:cystathionine beta-synthase